MSEHGAKRQRLTGSFSPASPPYHLAGKTSETKPPIVHPNTPTSPPYPAMTSQSHGGFHTGTYTIPADMTPPSSRTVSQQASQGGLPMGHPYPPSVLASTASLSHSEHNDDDGDAMMDDGEVDGVARVGGHRRSDHERQGIGYGAKGIYGSELFKLCQITLEPSQPHGLQNLFELYGLNELARSVARTDPVTGEKINKLRKSYEGHIKSLQIAGKPKAVKMDGALSMLANWPDEEHHIQKVVGKSMAGALSADQTSLDPAFADLLNSAISGMGPGTLPTADANKLRAYLGTDDVVKAKVALEAPQSRTVPSSTAATPHSFAPSAASRVSRPERAGSKRTYTDHSFSGYGEGFADDYAESTGGEDNAQGGIKRRKLAFDRSHQQSHQQVEVGGARR